MTFGLGSAQVFSAFQDRLQQFSYQYSGSHWYEVRGVGGSIKLALFHLTIAAG